MESSAVSCREKSGKVKHAPQNCDLRLSTSNLDAKRFPDECSTLSDSAYGSADSNLQAPLPLENNGAQGYSPPLEHQQPIEAAQQGISTEKRIKSKEVSAQVSSSPHPTTYTSFIINKDVEDVIKKKQFTGYDLHCLLQVRDKCTKVEQIVDVTGLNGLHQCIQHNRIELLKVFQAHGYWAALIKKKISSKRSEYSGCMPREMAECRRLRRAVTEIDQLSCQEESMSGKGAALQAARAGDLQLLKKLASGGNVDMKVTDSKKNNCVHWAAFSGNLEVVKYLKEDLKLQADLVNENGETPLHVAVMYGRHTLIPFMTKDCGLDPRNPDRSGKTPLQRTAENGDTASLAELQKLVLKSTWACRSQQLSLDGKSTWSAFWHPVVWNTCATTRTLMAKLVWWLQLKTDTWR